MLFHEDFGEENTSQAGRKAWTSWRSPLASPTTCMPGLLGFLQDLLRSG